MYRLLADAVVFLHLAFIAFIVFGGILALRWPWFAWVHLPLAFWGVVVQWMRWICPLTPLENWFRAHGGGRAYREGFVEHYLMPVLYPVGIGPRLHIALGALVLGMNALIYAVVLVRMRRKRNG